MQTWVDWLKQLEPLAALGTFFAGIVAAALVAVWQNMRQLRRELRGEIAIRTAPILTVAPMTELADLTQGIMQLLVKNSLGEVVRTYGTWGPPPKEVTWDGRDEAGLLVPDGHYSYDLLIVQEGGEPYTDDGYLTQVKTVGPKAAIQIEEGQHEEQPVKKEKGKGKEEKGKKKP